MTDPTETTRDSRKELTDIERRVYAECDNPVTEFHGLFRTGEEEADPEDETDEWDMDYWLTVYEGKYEGRDYLKIRYFAAHKSQPARDTFLKNGINIRIESEQADLGDLPLHLGQAIVAAYNGRDGDDCDIIDYLDKGVDLREE